MDLSAASMNEDNVFKFINGDISYDEYIGSAIRHNYLGGSPVRTYVWDMCVPFFTNVKESLFHFSKNGTR